LTSETPATLIFARLTDDAGRFITYLCIGKTFQCEKRPLTTICVENSLLALRKKSIELFHILFSQAFCLQKHLEHIFFLAVADAI
jgi:hypothetical protein